MKVTAQPERISTQAELDDTAGRLERARGPVPVYPPVVLGFGVEAPVQRDRTSA